MIQEKLLYKNVEPGTVFLGETIYGDYHTVVIYNRQYYKRVELPNSSLSSYSDLVNEIMIMIADKRGIRTDILRSKSTSPFYLHRVHHILNADGDLLFSF